MEALAVPCKEACRCDHVGSKSCQRLDGASCHIHPRPAIQAEQFEPKHVRRQLLCLVAFQRSTVARAELSSDRRVEYMQIMIRIKA